MKPEGTVAEVLANEARFCVVCGERDEVLAAMADAAVDVTITDPPYNERTHASCKTLRNHNADRVNLGFDALDGFEQP